MKETFFGKAGITSSEANHLTNIVKETVKGLEITNLNLITERMVFNGQTYKRDENKAIENIYNQVLKVGELYSLSAWLKSAIKYKEQLLDEISNREFTFDSPEPKMMFVEQSNTSFDAYLKTLNVKDLNTFYTAESMASHIGKFVHSFDNVRAILDNFEPTSLATQGEALIVIQRELLYDKKDIVDIFFELQKQHREYEKIVNSFKASHKIWEKKIRDEENDKQQILNTSYTKEYNEYNIAYRNALLKHQEEVRKDKESVSALRIVIPNNLKKVVDELSI